MKRSRADTTERDAPQDNAGKTNASALLERLKKRRNTKKAGKTQDETGPADKTPAATNVERPPHNPYITSQNETTRQKPSRGLVFRNRGHFSQLARTSRESERSEKIQEQLRKYQCYLPSEEPPMTEWWNEEADQPAHNKIHHPIEIPPTYGLLGPEKAKVYLTAHERRRMRKNEHLAKLKESQDRIRLGLDPPPQPKLRIATVASTFGSDYFKDPTRYEQIARDAEKARREKHEETNEQRKQEAQQLRPAKAKMDAKVAKDRSLYGTHACVYRFPQLHSGKARFLIDTSAAQLRLCGAALWNPTLKVAMVVAEGPPPELQKMTKLMTEKLEGSLVWTGEVTHGRFRRWSAHQFNDEKQVVDFLTERGALAYWKLATSQYL